MISLHIRLAFLVLALCPALAAAAPIGQIVIAQAEDPITLDPQAHEQPSAYNVLLNIYDTLVFRDKNLKIIPWLATSWKIVSPTTWEFKLRQGVKFHNGEPFDADAVKFSLNRLLDPARKNPQASKLRLLSSVEVVDQYTIRINTSKPFPTFLDQLALRGHVMAPKHFDGKDKVFADEKPVGTGPYRFVQWVKGQRIVLEANEQWWGGVPKVKTLIFRSIPDQTARVAALQAGDIDIAPDIPPHLVGVIQKNPGLYVSKTSSVRPIFILIPTYQFDAANKPIGPVVGPTSDKRVRQAILAAVDPDEIIRTVLDGNGIRTATPVTPEHFGFDKTLAPVKKDPDRARKLLAEAGFPNGVELTLNSPSGVYPKDKEVAEAVAAQLTQAGIRTRVRTFEWATYLNEHVYSHNANPMYLIGWGNTTWDADGTLNPLFRSGNPQANYYNPEFDKLIDEAQVSIDLNRRLALYARAQRTILDDGAVLSLYQQVDIYGVNRRVNFQALSSRQFVGAWMSLRDSGPPKNGGGDKDNFAVIRVFYATDRKPRPSPAVNFGPERHPQGKLTLGTSDVSVPREHKLGTLERPSILRLEFRQDPRKHFVLLARTVSQPETFYKELSTRVQQSQGKEAFVFIHGFNVTFDDAVYRTAQISYDLGFAGAPILYSWPSNGEVLRYSADQNNSDWSIDHLRAFLLEVVARSQARSVHLIAHSMGNRILVGALDRLAADPNFTVPPPKFTEIVLTAPDIDADVFRQLATAIKKSAQRVTLYASDNDRALHLSKTLQIYHRAGEAGSSIVVVPGIDTIDVSAVDTDLVGHFYYGDNRSVLGDMFNLLRGQPPPRFGLKEVIDGPLRHWRFVQ